MIKTVAAVDLGASSGRVVRGRIGPGELTLDTVARFANGPVELGDGWHWDAPALRDAALAGLADCGPLDAIAVDSWAVDYGLLRAGELLAPPWCYRDTRTTVGVERVHAAVSPADLYRRTGLQFLPFNTVYQLGAETRLAEAERLLLIADLVTWWLTGTAVCERTNASTTGLLGLDGRWDRELCDLVGLREDQLGELIEPGDVVGSHRETPVVAVGSHDTASAVVGVPMTDGDAAYISCGTWGLVGVELDRPVLTEAARAANFTHEGGVDGRIRFLTNVMGTWLLSETLRAWGVSDLPGLLAQATEYGGPVPLVDVQDPRFVWPNEAGPGAMPDRLMSWCRERDELPPQGRAGLVRTIVASLAAAFGAAVETAAELSGVEVRRVHVVGGGAQNELLCQLLADRLGLPVLAGPTEATALGNVLVQGRAIGAVTGTLEDLRALVAATQRVRALRPRPQVVR